MFRYYILDKLILGGIKLEKIDNCIDTPFIYPVYTPTQLADHVRMESQADRFPIDPIRIASRYKIPVYRVAREHIITKPQQEVVGGADIKEGIPRICVSGDLSPARTRFVAAHILGHIFMKHITPEKSLTEDRRIFKTTYWETLERDANLFALALLMPPCEVEDNILKGANFNELTKYFGVSEHILYLRLYSLGII